MGENKLGRKSFQIPRKRSVKNNQRGRIIEAEIAAVEKEQGRNTEKIIRNQKNNNQNMPYMLKKIGIGNKAGKIVMEENLVKETLVEYFTELLKEVQVVAKIYTDKIIVQEVKHNKQQSQFKSTGKDYKCGAVRFLVQIYE